MADLSRKLPENVPGEFFVDSTCIDCDTCRQIAPEIFTEKPEYSVVARQPATEAEQRAAMQALLACPTSSIGTEHRLSAREVMQDFPMPIAENISYLGFNSEKSFGANSYLIEDPAGNWMVDSPRMTPHLVRQIEARGGLKTIFLTHRDDVADAGLYAKRFGAERIIHADERAAMPDAEQVVTGTEPRSFGENYLVIPTPGHTIGHCVLLYRDRYLFTGDHLWFSRRSGKLGASRSVCWHNWEAQTRSMERLLEYRFEWVLPGHGRRGHLAAPQMQRELRHLVASMRNPC